MVDCTRLDIRDTLPDLVHGQLEPFARASVEQHIAECAECAAELKLLRELRSSAFATPAVDVARVAAGVHASMAASRESVGGVVPISVPREHRGPAVGSARAMRHPSWYDWRAAASIAAVAVGIGAYTLSRTPTSARSREALPTAVAAAPTPVEAPSSAAMTAGVAAGVGADVGVPESGTLILGYGVSDLSENDMQALLQTVDDLEAMPDLDPHPLPLLARVVEGEGEGAL